MEPKQIYAELNAFMGKMRDGDAQDIILNMQGAINYLLEKLHVLEEIYSKETGRARPKLDDKARRRLAGKAHLLNLSLLSVIEDTWSPETILTWHRKLIAEKYNSYKEGVPRGGRPPVPIEAIDLILKIARANPSWGYERIASYMAYLGHKVSARTVQRIMNEQGLFPTGWRSHGDWSRFFNAHKGVLAACDFATYELLTPDGLVRESILFFEDLTTREVWLGGIACNPDGEWMAQVARNQTDAIDGRLNAMKYLIHDSDPLFTGKFRRYLSSSGCKCKKLPPRTPELNGYIESFIRTIKGECLNHFILQTEEQLRYVVSQYLEYYNHERPHSGLGGAMIKPLPQDDDGEIVEFTRLGGFLRSYRRVKPAA